jgi:hypothetical protein
MFLLLIFHNLKSQDICVLFVKSIHMDVPTFGIMDLRIQKLYNSKYNE